MKLQTRNSAKAQKLTNIKKVRWDQKRKRAQSAFLSLNYTTNRFHFVHAVSSFQKSFLCFPPNLPQTHTDYFSKCWIFVKTNATRFNFFKNLCSTEPERIVMICRGVFWFAVKHEVFTRRSVARLRLTGKPKRSTKCQTSIHIYDCKRRC